MTLVNMFTHKYKNTYLYATPEAEPRGILLIKEFKTEETVFRKFITKRLQRAYVIVKIPKNKKTTMLGDIIDIESKSYQGNLVVFIEKGNIKLNTVKETTQIKLYSGNVYASLKNTNIDVVSNIGNIKVDTLLKGKRYQKKIDNVKKSFIVNTIKGNVFLSSLKTQ